MIPGPNNCLDVERERKEEIDITYHSDYRFQQKLSEEFALYSQIRTLHARSCSHVWKLRDCASHSSVEK